MATIEKYSKTQFRHIALKDDCTKEDAKVVSAVNAETFTDGYKFGFDETASPFRRDVRCEFRNSLYGGYAVFFYQGKATKFNCFICDRDIDTLLQKVYDLVFCE